MKEDKYNRVGEIVTTGLVCPYPCFVFSLTALLSMCGLLIKVLGGLPWKTEVCLNNSGLTAGLDLRCTTCLVVQVSWLRH